MKLGDYFYACQDGNGNGLPDGVTLVKVVYIKDSPMPIFYCVPGGLRVDSNWDCLVEIIKLPWMHILYHPLYSGIKRVNSTDAKFTVPPLNIIRKYTVYPMFGV